MEAPVGAVSAAGVGTGATPLVGARGVVYGGGVSRTLLPRVPGRTTTTALVVVVLLVAAAALVPAYVHERRLSRAQDALASSPARALTESVGADFATTGPRLATLRVAALVRLGRLREAEALAQGRLDRDRDDPIAARLLLQVQLLRRRTAAAAHTREILRRLDPKYAAGTGV